MRLILLSILVNTFNHLQLYPSQSLSFALQNDRSFILKWKKKKYKYKIVILRLFLAKEKARKINNSSSTRGHPLKKQRINPRFKRGPRGLRKSRLSRRRITRRFTRVAGCKKKFCTGRINRFRCSRVG